MLAIALAVLFELAPDVTRLDGALERAYSRSGPGAAIVVVTDGRVVFRKAYGLANTDTKKPLGPGSVMPVGSVSKPFTAAAVLSLVAEGKLSLDAPVRSLIPGFPEKSNVTVDHLLTHTSGIASFTDLPAWQERMQKDPQAGVPATELLAMILAQPPLFEAGSAEAYSNSDYFLLAQIVERVTGVPFEEALRSRVFKPLGMVSAGCASPHGAVTGYRKREAAFEPEPFLGPAGCHGSGGVAASADDLARWNLGLSANALLPASTRTRMLTPSILPKGPGTYARGWEVWDHEGHRYLWHGGYTWGFLSAVVHDVDARTTVAMVSNNVSPVEELDLQYLAKRLTLMAAGRGGDEPSAVRVDPLALARYSGLYRDPAGAERKVIARGDQLFTQRVGGARYEIKAETPERFFYANSFVRLTFVRDGSGGTTLVEAGEGPAVTWTRLGDLPVRQSVQLPAPVLEGYVGRYEIRPGNALVVTLENGRLFGQPTGGARDEFLASGEADFYIESGDTEFTFVRGPGGKVTAVRLHEGDWHLDAARWPD